MEDNFTTELFEDYYYKVKIIGHIVSKDGRNQQYIAISHGRIFNLVETRATYNPDGKEDLLTGVKVYEMNLKQLYNLYRQKDKYLYHIPFDKIPYEDPKYYNKYKKICFDNFDIFKLEGTEEYFMRVNLCWEKLDNEEFSRHILKDIL